jgi:hypothetical protein
MYTQKRNERKKRNVKRRKEKLKKKWRTIECKNKKKNLHQLSRKINV